ncbi:MAG TPA: septal ring lytic transglycosylase RlpA family protein [Solirubrobacterales bacterium]
MRGAISLAAIAITVLGGVSAAQAATGGASSVVAFGGAGVIGEDIAFGQTRTAGATWYGPGLYGNHTACGQTLRPGTIGVAHRTLPCGTTVKFSYHGRFLITQVIDRGPYSRGNAWDLTNGARRLLGFEGANRVRYAVAQSFARR